MDKRLFDNTNYSQKTLEIFEIISAYYVDIFYNHLYIEAKKLKVNKSVASITEGYKHTLNAFLKSLDNLVLYKKNIAGLHHFFITLGYSSLSFAKCIDNIVREFIPTDYFSSLSISQKMGVLKSVINNTCKNFIKKIVESYMVKIIDYHTDKDNVRIFQDDLIDCLILERELLFQKFISEKTEVRPNNDIFVKMQTEIKRLLKEKYELQKLNLSLKKIIIKLNNEKKQQLTLTPTIVKETTLINPYNLLNNTSNSSSNNTSNSSFNNTSNNTSNSSFNKFEHRSDNIRSDNIRSDNNYDNKSNNIRSQFISQNKQPSIHIKEISNLNNTSIVELKTPVGYHEIKSNIDIEDIDDDNDEDNLDSIHTNNNNTNNNNNNNTNNNTNLDDDNDDNDNVGFIEVNDNNIGSIVKCDNTALYKYINHNMDNNPLCDF